MRLCGPLQCQLKGIGIIAPVFLKECFAILFGKIGEGIQIFDGIGRAPNETPEIAAEFLKNGRLGVEDLFKLLRNLRGLVL